MRIGCLMLGHGAHAAAAVGVLRELRLRGVEPHAVIGLHAGAYAAAMIAAGKSDAQMDEALRQLSGGSMASLLGHASGRHLLKGRTSSLCRGKRLNAMLCAHVGERMLALCEGRAAFLFRLQKTGRRMILSTCPMDEQRVNMQVSAAFAARAALALPPLLEPLTLWGERLLPCADTRLACRLLRQMGAQGILIILPQAEGYAETDWLDVMGAMSPYESVERRELRCALLRVRMPPMTGPMDLRGICRCAEAGEQEARRSLETVFTQLGVMQGRILPFTGSGTINR